MHRDAQRLSELGIAAGKATASDPFIPTLLEVLLAYLTDSPEAALALMDAHARDPNLPVDQVLVTPLVAADLLDVRARFFRAAGTPESVRAVVGGVRAVLDAALAQAAREIERHMPEAAPQIGEAHRADHPCRKLLRAREGKIGAIRLTPIAPYAACALERHSLNTCCAYAIPSGGSANRGSPNGDSRRRCGRASGDGPNGNGDSRSANGNAGASRR